VSKFGGEKINPMIQPETARELPFWGFFIDAQNRRLRRSDQVVSLNSKYFDVLLLLVGHLRKRRLGARRIQSQLMRQHNCSLSRATINKVLQKHSQPPLKKAAPRVRHTIATGGKMVESYRTTQVLLKGGKW
jgi:hypothetical protein